MPGQSSFTYTPPSCSPHASPPSNSFTTVLPSFDDLVASTLVNDTHPLTDSPSTFHQPKPLPFVHPRKTPQIPLMSLTPPEPAESPADIQRAPSTQSARTPPRGRPRQRAASAPAIYRRSTFGPASPLQSYKRCAEPAPEPGHALGLSRMSSFAEHHGDRVKEIRDGDGAFAVNDAVLPEVLPEVGVNSMLLGYRTATDMTGCKTALLRTTAVPRSTLLDHLAASLDQLVPAPTGTSPSPTRTQHLVLVVLLVELLPHPTHRV